MSLASMNSARMALAGQIARVGREIHYVIGIDPASRCTGLAVIAVGSGRVIDMAKSEFSSSDPVLDRVRGIADDIETWIRSLPIEGLDPSGKLPPTIGIAIEVPTASRSSTTQNQSKGFGLTTYARAVGRAEARAEQLAHSRDHVFCIDERTWTGRQSKSARACGIAATVPDYVPAQDKGMDIADAIGIARWTANLITVERGGKE